MKPGLVNNIVKVLGLPAKIIKSDQEVQAIKTRKTGATTATIRNATGCTRKSSC